MLLQRSLVRQDCTPDSATAQKDDLYFIVLQDPDNELDEGDEVGILSMNGAEAGRARWLSASHIPLHAK